MYKLEPYQLKMLKNSKYGKISMLEEANDQTTMAIRNSWDKWPEIKDTVTDFGYSDWVKREGGFEFKRHYSGIKAVVTAIHDEQKYAWFLLKWT